MPTVGRGTPIRNSRRDGSTQTLDGLSLDPVTSRAIFNRTGDIQRLAVFHDL
jgi:hypothetical protein